MVRIHVNLAAMAGRDKSVDCNWDLDNGRYFRGRIRKFKLGVAEHRQRSAGQKGRKSRTAEDDPA